jgi:hypothetical protein
MEWTKKNGLCFVQFIHPGGEHTPDNNGHIKNWNKGKHKRKFVKNFGKYLSLKGDKWQEQIGDIIFWCEWSPESRIIKRIISPIHNGPEYISFPYYVLPKNYKRLQGTDPFVFGERFHYTVCQQYKGKTATTVRSLEKGSVILFGSCINRDSFVIDTVFVVDHWIEHSKKNYKNVLKNNIPNTYTDVTISPLYQNLYQKTKKDISFRLYFGATYNKPVNGMFSFFPCCPYNNKLKGFARPRIEIKNVITNNLLQGKKLNPQNNIKDVKKLWDEVVKQVKKHKLMLGIYTQLPPRMVEFNVKTVLDLFEREQKK